jgi:hypothetical protein
MTGACPDDRDLTVFFSLAPAPLSGAEPVAGPGELRPAPEPTTDMQANCPSGVASFVFSTKAGGGPA